MKKIAVVFGRIMFLSGVLAFGQAMPEAYASGVPVSENGKAVLTPPFVSNFDTKEDLDNWTIVDRDQDGTTWTYVYHSDWPALDGSQEGGCLYTGFNMTRTTDDWLVTRMPVRLSEGMAHIAFLYAAGHRAEDERLAVYYGTSPDPGELEKAEGNELDLFVFHGRDWKFKLIEFSIEAAGDYYFAIRSCSDAYKLNTYVDEIEIGEGKYVGAPNLVLDYLSLPVSSCALGDGEVALQLVNRGKTAIERFELAYGVNDGETVRQTFDVRIPLLDTVRVAFSQKADFSEVGMRYGVRVEGKVVTSESGAVEPDGLLADNVIEGEVRHFMEAGLPFVSDMNEEDGREQWGYAAGTWSYDPSRVLAIRAEDTLPIVSRCLTLRAGRNYRFNFSYVAGIEVLAMQVAEDFDILYGLSGTPVSDWTLLKRYENILTDNYLADDEIVFPVTADGSYAFAIVPRTEFGVLLISKVAVSEIKEHDVELRDWVTRLGRMTPARHAVKPSFEALVANRGMNDETGVNVVIKQGDREIGRSAEAAIRKDSLAVFRPIDGLMDEPALNSEVTLSLTVEMPVEDGNVYDNTAEFTFTATDTLYVFDEVADNPTHGVGAEGLAIGNIFTLAEEDTLTAVTVAWVDLSDQISEDFDVAIEVYPVDMATKRVREAILHHQVKRGLKGGFRTIEFPARILSAGSYLIGVRQLGYQNITVAVDEGDGYFFVTGNGTYAIQGDRGFLGVRAVFGTVTSLKARDVAVGDIVAPKAVGAFTARQAIRVEYANHGFETMEVEFKCTVNEQVLTTNKTVSGYETGRVSFTADMSKVGAYTITVEAIAAGDENPDNNAVRKTVECIVIDARIMNFEYCDDFSISGFQPAWKSIDMDKVTPGPHNLTIPNVDAPFGFMAYNSYVAGEIDEHTGQVVNVAHGGDRCGMSLVTRPKSNDWLISPEFSMASKADSLGMSFWVRSSDPEYKEWYNVLVSTTDDQTTSFEIVPDENGAMLREAPGEWTRVWVDLKDYAGKNIYVAIQCVSQDAWMFLVDDIEVKTGGLSSEPVVDLSRYVKSYPNPVSDVWTVTAYDLSIRRVEICNMTGEVVFRSADNLGVETYRVGMSDFTSGLYMARVYTNAGTQMVKIMVK